MKLRAKLTINFILLVVITLLVSFFTIGFNLQKNFQTFIQEKNHQIDLNPNDDLPVVHSKILLINPAGGFFPGDSTPEERFLHTVNSSLFWSGLIAIFIAILIAYFLSDFLLRRIYRLKNSMQQQMHDGITTIVPHEDIDEVDDLAKIYNSLIEKLQKEEKIRKEFFIDMSHELRTPLTSIKGYLEGLIDGVFDNKKMQDVYGKTLSETDRMIRLVQEMTSLAKLEVGDVTIRKTKVNLKDLTNEVIESLEQELKSKNLTTKVEGSVEAMVDKDKFKQVIINLFDNAICYGQENSNITVKMSNDPNLSWSISNKISTISSNDLAHFFDRFYRNDKSRTYDSKKPHLGIGLNIVKKIIEKHSGKITPGLDGNEIIFEITL